MFILKISSVYAMVNMYIMCIHNQETQRTDKRMGHHSLKGVLLRIVLEYVKESKRCPLKNIQEVYTICMVKQVLFSVLRSVPCVSCATTTSRGYTEPTTLVFQQLHDGMAALLQTSWLLNRHRKMVATKTVFCKSFTASSNVAATS